MGSGDAEIKISWVGKSRRIDKLAVAEGPLLLVMRVVAWIRRPLDEATRGVEDVCWRG